MAAWDMGAGRMVTMAAQGAVPAVVVLWAGAWLLWPRMGDVVVVSRVLCHGMPRSSARVATCSRGWLVIWDCGWFITCVVHTA